MRSMPWLGAAVDVMIEGSEAELLTKDYARENYWRVVKRESGGELLVGQVMHASAPAKKRKKGAPPESGRLHIRYDDGSECDYDLDSLLDLCTEGEQALQAAVQAAEGLQVRLLRSTERLDSEIMPDEEREREFGGASLRSVEADFIVGPLRVGLKLRLDNDDREEPFRTINITANGHVHHSLFSEIYVHSPPGEPWKQHLPGMGGAPEGLLLSDFMEVAGLDYDAWPSTFSDADRTELAALQGMDEAEDSWAQDREERFTLLSDRRSEGLFCDIFSEMVRLVMAEHGEVAPNGVTLGVHAREAFDQYPHTRASAH